ncbi:adenylosuccinate synthase [archaeon]|nr:adenylosuccinate synthase [archaeon]NCQ51948.1 adenylosuccinate synthase [archaeon]
MKNAIIIGAQWGDEGKGKIVDYFAKNFKHVVRFHGGHNAGHTLWVDGKKTVLHLIPSGVLHSDINCYIGSGVVVSLDALLKEIEGLNKENVNIEGRFFIAENCPLILNVHSLVDQASEARKTGSAKIGTTGRGIGPAYEDNVGRRSVRVHHLYESSLKDRLENLIAYYKSIYPESEAIQKLNITKELKELIAQSKKIKNFVSDVPNQLFKLQQKKIPLLFEGAQGAMLDVSFGTYPYVTSSHCVASQAASGSGLGMSGGYKVIGVAKAYCTRVGSGLFPTEQDNEVGQKIRDLGGEYGATTGRPRRCGWFDIPALKRAIQINGITDLAITKMDILDKFDEIQVCTHYVDEQENKIDVLPFSIEKISKLTPVYKTFKGWLETTQSISDYNKLPKKAKTYFDYLEKKLEVKISIISTGPEREQTLLK